LMGVKYFTSVPFPVNYIVGGRVMACDYCLNLSS
jgi:hypothetical protein